MHPFVQILAILVSLTILAGTLELVRRGKLRSEYSLIWVITAFALLVLSVFRGSLQELADFLGIGYGPTLLLMAGLTCITIIQIIQNVLLSNLSLRNRELAQEHTIQEWHLQQVEKGQADVRLQFAVYVAGARLNTILEWDPLVEQLLKSVIDLVHADSASLILIDERHGNLYIEAATHLPKEVINAAHLKIGEGVAGWVAQHREAVLIVGKASPDKFPECLPKLNPIGSSICVPLITPSLAGQPGTVIGVLNINRQSDMPALTRNELELVTTLSIQAAVALGNARLIRHLRQSQELEPTAQHLGLFDVDKGDGHRNEQTKDIGDWLGRSDLRLAETVGERGTIAHLAKTAPGGDGGGTCQHDSADDGSGVDLLHDGEESG